MELKAYLAIIWRRKWVVVITTFVTVVIVAVGTLITTPIYEASTMMRVATAADGSIDYADYMYAERLMNTYSEIATSGPVVEEIMQRFDLAVPPEIQVEVLPNTEIIQFTVEDENPTLAAGEANALVDILIAQSRELYTGSGRSPQDILGEQLARAEDELDQAQEEYERLIARSVQDLGRIDEARRPLELKERTYASLLEQYDRIRISDAVRASAFSVVEPAVVPVTPVKPRVALNISLGLVIGLAGGIGLAFLFENLDSTLYSSEQIERVTDLPTLVQIPIQKRPQQMVCVFGQSLQTEAFRRLRTNVFAQDHILPLRTLMTASAELGEGKSTIVTNLACSLAGSGRKVLVIDADMRKPAIHDIFDLPNSVGLSEVLRQQATVATATQRYLRPHLDVLTSGSIPSNPSELLGSSQMATLIEQLAEKYDNILLDTPSMLAVTDAAVLARIVDGVMLVVSCGISHRENVEASLQQLDDVGARIIGTVVNRTEYRGSYSYYYPTTGSGGTTQATLQQLDDVKDRIVRVVVNQPKQDGHNSGHRPKVGQEH